LSELKCAVVSLGCPKNLVDSEVMLGIMEEAGYAVTADQTDADVIVVNTCGFIDLAKEESIDVILKCAQLKKPEYGKCRVLAVAGCLVQRYAVELLAEIPEIDAVLGTGDFPKIVDVIQCVLNSERVKLVGEPKFLYDHKFPRLNSMGPRTAYVKIAEGCDNRCAYCVIPSIRGRFRSRPIESVVLETEALVAEGIQEIILVAQDTTRYGEDIYGRYVLADLLRELARIDGLMWIRFLYAYPTRFEDRLIELIAQEARICKYVDLPLQHASDEILRRMNRQGTQADIRRLVGKLREQIPDITIRSSFMVGFPGETEEHFLELLDFLREMEFDRIGIFKFSCEEGSPAATFPGQIAHEVADERYDRAMKLQQRISRSKMKSKVGDILDVLVEGQSEESDLVIVGRSQGEAPEIDGIVYISNGFPYIGQFRRVRITDAGDYDLVGEVVE
jgi:ribosomal protein S12 methylthiotransferase